MTEQMELAAESVRAYVRDLLAGLSLLALGGVASVLANWLIVTRFPDRPAPRDLLFELLPYVGCVRYLTAVALVLSAAVFAIHAIRRTPERLPEIAAVFGLMYLFRSAMMVLTPLADAYGPGAFVFSLEQHGMFPSGHVAAMLLFVLLTDGTAAPRVKRALIGLLVVGSAALVIAHGHYSIDVVGGLLLGYFVEKEWTAGSAFGAVRRAVGLGGR